MSKFVLNNFLCREQEGIHFHKEHFSFLGVLTAYIKKKRKTKKKKKKRMCKVLNEGYIHSSRCEIPSLFFPNTDSELVLLIPRHFKNSMRLAKARENNTE